MWRDPFLWMFVFMVLLDVGVIVYGFIRVRLFLKKAKMSLPEQERWFVAVQTGTVSNPLKDRLRDYQNRPV